MTNQQKPTKAKDLQKITESTFVKDGWLEAARAWEICESIHSKWAKRKDAFFSTRQQDFKRHAEQARAKANTAFKVVPTDHQVLAITVAYEQGVGKGHQAYESGEEIENPYDTWYRCNEAWQLGYEEGKKQAMRNSTTSPVAAPKQGTPTMTNPTTGNEQKALAARKQGGAT